MVWKAKIISWGYIFVAIFILLYTYAVTLLLFSVTYLCTSFRATTFGSIAAAGGGQTFGGIAVNQGMGTGTGM